MKRKNLRLVMAEHALSEGMIAMAIMTPFWQSLGLSFAEITLTQAIFTIAVMLLDVPMGYVADRFSRKWANVIGDFGNALFHFFYAFATGFTTVVLAEIGLGIFYSLSSGVDASLLRHFVLKDGGDGGEFRKYHAKMILYGNMVALPLVLLGGPLGAISFRFAVFVSGIPRLLAGIVSLFVDDDSVKLERGRTAQTDILRIARESFSSPKLRVRIFAYAVVREMSHPVIWILTPILMTAGVPLEIVSAAWAIDSVMRILGNKLAAKFASRWTAFMTVLAPVLMLFTTLFTLFVQISIWTIPIYLLAGLACGFTGAALIPLVQAEARPEEQTTVISIAKTMANLVYIPTVWLVGVMADFNLNYACGCLALTFGLLALPVLFQLKREH